MAAFTYKKICSLVDEVFATSAKLNILDFGCGNGELLEYFPQSRIKKYLGVDINDESIKKAKLKNKAKNVSFKIIDRKNDMFGIRNSMDVIISIGVLQYMSDQETTNFLKMAKKMLKKRGILIISCATDHFIYRMFNLYGIFLPNRFVNRNWLVMLLKKIGFTVDYQKETGLLLAPLFSHNIVFFFDAMDKILFKTKGELGVVGLFVRKLAYPLLWLEASLPVDFGYNLTLRSS